MVEITSHYTLEETKALLEKIIATFGKEQITTTNWTMVSKDVPRLWCIVFDTLGLNYRKTGELSVMGSVFADRKYKQKNTMGKMIWDKERFPTYRVFREWFKDESKKSDYSFEVMRCYPRSICVLLQQNKAQLSSIVLSEFYKALFVHNKDIKKISLDEDDESLRLTHKIITNSFFGMVTGSLILWESPFEPKHHYDETFEKARQYMEHAVVDGIITKQDTFNECVSIFQNDGYEIELTKIKQ